MKDIFHLRHANHQLNLNISLPLSDESWLIYILFFARNSSQLELAMY